MTRVASQIRDQRHWSHAVALLCFLPGVPSVYYGDEFGLEAIKEDRPSGDDAVRLEMPPERGLVDHSHPGVEETYRRMIGLRRRHPWLVDGVLPIELVEKARLIVRSRARLGEESLTLALNPEATPLMLSNAAEMLEAQPALAGAVPPHGWAVTAG